MSTFGECVPVQEFKLIAGGIVKKYELQCIIERYGHDNNHGHFWANIKRRNIWFKADDLAISRKNFPNFANSTVSCVYKHVLPVTRRTSEDVTQIMEEEANIITDDQFSTVEEVPQVVDSDSNLTDEEKKSMICI